MEDHCINCGNLLEKRNKGFNRKSIDSPTKTSVTFPNILESTLNVPITPENNLFMCAKKFRTVKLELFLLSMNCNPKIPNRHI